MKEDKRIVKTNHLTIFILSALFSIFILLRNYLFLIIFSFISLICLFIALDFNLAK